MTQDDRGPHPGRQRGKGRYHLRIDAAGGRGGLGNAALASSRRKAPGFALLGEPGEARDVVLELKSIADIGLVRPPVAPDPELVTELVLREPTVAALPADHPLASLPRVPLRRLAGG